MIKRLNKQSIKSLCVN